MYPGSFGKAPDDQSGAFTLGIKTTPAVYANRRGPRSLKASENVCQLIFAFLTLRRRSVLRTSLIERCLRSAESFFMSHPFWRYRQHVRHPAFLDTKLLCVVNEPN